MVRGTPQTYSSARRKISTELHDFPLPDEDRRVKGTTQVAKEQRKTMATDLTTHPYGPGSHGPLSEVREMPVCYPMKGNVDSMLYHRPDSQNYGETVAEVWFDSPSAAEAAGFALAPGHSTDGGTADYEPGGSGHPCSAAQVNKNREAVVAGSTAIGTVVDLAPLGGGVSDRHPYGSGSHGPLSEVREMPVCYPMKGNVDSMLYHRPDSQNYGATVAEVWFDSPSAAEAAGFALAPGHSTDGGTADYEPGGSGHTCGIAAVNANRSAVIGAEAAPTAGSRTVNGVSGRGLARYADDGGDGAGAVGSSGPNPTTGSDRGDVTAWLRSWWWLVLLLLVVVLVVLLVRFS